MTFPDPLLILAVERHAKHEIEDCDCSPLVVLTTLHLRDLIAKVQAVMGDLPNAV